MILTNWIPADALWGCQKLSFLKNQVVVILFAACKS